MTDSDATAEGDGELADPPLSEVGKNRPGLGGAGQITDLRAPPAAESSKTRSA